MKNFYFLAFLFAMLLFGCTADGVFDGDPSNVQWSKDISSPSATPSSSSFTGSDPYGSCIIQGYCYNSFQQSDCSSYGGSFSLAACPSSSSSLESTPSSSSVVSTTGSCTIASGSCRENVLQGNCSGTFSLNGECNIGIYIYCAYGGSYGDCDLIGGYYTESKDECLDIPNSVFATYDYCIANGYEIYD
jgi:hypothetical protein